MRSGFKQRGKVSQELAGRKVGEHEDEDELQDEGTYSYYAYLAGNLLSPKTTNSIPTSWARPHGEIDLQLGLDAAPTKRDCLRPSKYRRPRLRREEALIKVS
ncbi:hypothetical protein CLCR_06467 [Cladophialophora carrionii]|uniref:Uncharacterized protein n=1 Tax=Cladophialophora carrionii TaxID=86049 RepID=A0A1C1C813_9EURO|nr:hypothetical protein CLCR_06467 [Cladophialophora carrionii]